MKLEKFFNSKIGKIIISVILGLGLASLFRKVCNDRNCIVFKAPSLEELSNQVYKYNDKCVKLKPNSIPCDNKKKMVSFS
jgi:hypothetical protein